MTGSIVVTYSPFYFNERIKVRYATSDGDNLRSVFQMSYNIQFSVIYGVLT